MNMDDNTDWSTDYEALMNEFEEIRDRWVAMLEEEPAECHQAMDQQRISRLVHWASKVRKFRKKWGSEMMTETLKSLATEAEVEANIKNPIDYHN